MPQKDVKGKKADEFSQLRRKYSVQLASEILGDDIREDDIVMDEDNFSDNGSDDDDSGRSNSFDTEEDIISFDSEILRQPTRSLSPIRETTRSLSPIMREEERVEEEERMVKKISSPRRLTLSKSPEVYNIEEQRKRRSPRNEEYMEEEPRKRRSRSPDEYVEEEQRRKVKKKPMNRDKAVGNGNVPDLTCDPNIFIATHIGDVVNALTNVAQDIQCLSQLHENMKVGMDELCRCKCENEKLRKENRMLKNEFKMLQAIKQNVDALCEENSKMNSKLCFSATRLGKTRDTESQLMRLKEALANIKYSDNPCDTSWMQESYDSCNNEGYDLCCCPADFCSNVRYNATKNECCVDISGINNNCCCTTCKTPLSCNQCSQNVQCFNSVKSVSPTQGEQNGCGIQNCKSPERSSSPCTAEGKKFLSSGICKLCLKPTGNRKCKQNIKPTNQPTVCITRPTEKIEAHHVCRSSSVKRVTREKDGTLPENT